MARPKLAVPSVEKNISLPQDLAVMVDLELWSEVEGRVPFGAWKGFITRVIRQHFERQGRAQALHARLAVICEETPDAEHRHLRMDNAILEELALLGYHRAVSTFSASPKWYA